MLTVDILCMVVIDRHLAVTVWHTSAGSMSISEWLIILTLSMCVISWDTQRRPDDSPCVIQSQVSWYIHHYKCSDISLYWVWQFCFTIIIYLGAWMQRCVKPKS